MMKVHVCPKAGKGIVAAAVVLGALAVGPIQSQAAEGPKMGGHVESTGNVSFIKAKKGGSKTNELRSYDGQANTFLLNSAHVTLAGNGTENLSYTVEIDAGTDATIHRDPGLGSGVVDLQEAYMKYSFTDMLSLTMGHFATFQGIEVMEGPANPTVSRGYLFGLAEAFTHTGFFLTLAPMEMLEVKLGASNDGLKDVLKDTNNEKSLLARVGVNLGDPLSFGISPIVGGAADLSIDLTGVSNVVSGMPVNFQINYGKLDKSKWYGVGLQPVYDVSDTMSLGLRVEYFADPEGARSGITQPNPADPTQTIAVDDLTEINVTVAPAWKPVEGFAVRPELRLDLANEKIFVKDASSSSKTNITASLGLSYMF